MSQYPFDLSDIIEGVKEVQSMLYRCQMCGGLTKRTDTCLDCLIHQLVNSKHKVNVRNGKSMEDEP